MAASPVSDTAIEEFRHRVVGRSISEDTFEAYKLWINRFERWYDGTNPSLRDLEDFDTLLYDPVEVPWQNDSGRRVPESYSFQSRSQAMSAIIMWLRRHYDVDIPEQPGDIARGEPEPFDPTYLDKSRVVEVVESAPDACGCHGCQAALALSYDAILRASECVRLTVSDVDLERGIVAVTASKKSRDSDISILDRTVGYIEDYLNEADHSTGALFRNTYGKEWDKSSWATHVRQNHIEAGSHAWGRHTPILHMFQSGSPFGEVYRRARHRSPDTTARYARYVDADIPAWGGE